eukprot:scaffold2611_cov114-Isochrysis_galbana.AAC.13
MLPLTVRVKHGVTMPAYRSPLVHRQATRWNAHSRLTRNGVAPPNTVICRFSLSAWRHCRALVVVRIPRPRKRKPVLLTPTPSRHPNRSSRLREAGVTVAAAASAAASANRMLLLRDTSAPLALPAAAPALPPAIGSGSLPAHQVCRRPVGGGSALGVTAGASRSRLRTERAPTTEAFSDEASTASSSEESVEASSPESYASHP